MGHGAAGGSICNKGPPPPKHMNAASRPLVSHITRPLLHCLAVGRCISSASCWVLILSELRTLREELCRRCRWHHDMPSSLDGPGRASSHSNALAVQHVGQKKGHGTKVDSSRTRASSHAFMLGLPSEGGTTSFPAGASGRGKGGDRLSKTNKHEADLLTWRPTMCARSRRVA